MPLALFVLALYIFLQSASGLGWFAVDAKLLGFVGIAFVIVVILEAIWAGRSGNWPWKRHQ